MGVGLGVEVGPHPSGPHVLVGDGVDDGVGVGVGAADDDGGGGGAELLGVRVGLGFPVGLAFCVWVGDGLLVGDGGGVYGSCPVTGAVPSRFAGGGKSSTGSPSMSLAITAVHVRAG